jgi:hypothetical protein
LLDRINSISRDTTTGVKFIGQFFTEDPENHPGKERLNTDIIVNQPELPKELKNITISRHVEKFLDTLFLDDITISQDKIETYLHGQI